MLQPQLVLLHHLPEAPVGQQFTKRSLPPSSIWCSAVGKPHICYHLPGNESIEGSSFGVNVLDYLKTLGLLDQKDRYIVPSSFLRDHSPVFLTAADNVYYRPSLMAIRSLQEHFPFQKIVFYDLGLTEVQASHIDRLCNVERIVFPFWKYPNYVHNLKEYRWKPIIIANNKAGPKFSIVLHASTGHGIYSATSPEVYKYIPTDFNRVKSMSAMMYQAGLVLAFRTKQALEDIILWYVACALKKDCMGPEDASSFCRFKDREHLAYAGCHRYDQSVLNLLLANRLNYEQEQWSSGFNSFYRIERHQVNDTHPPFEC
ncbi:DUF1647 domain containing protein [Trichuris trichiura]|uniref:DUF1647 domain containing protein n=1 Tax=Trichuris trichiura TaxID=36087 RepID=A0A077ZDF3_TRITR|nr:DUF1647 domain containing protein [Trichuris trichiura]